MNDIVEVLTKINTKIMSAMKLISEMHEMQRGAYIDDYKRLSECWMSIERKRLILDLKAEDDDDEEIDQEESVVKDPIYEPVQEPIPTEDQEVIENG